MFLENVVRLDCGICTILLELPMFLASQFIRSDHLVSCCEAMSFLKSILFLGSLRLAASLAPGDCAFVSWSQTVAFRTPEIGTVSACGLGHTDQSDILFQHVQHPIPEVGVYGDDDDFALVLLEDANGESIQLTEDLTGFLKQLTQ